MKDQDFRNFIPLGKTFASLAKVCLGVLSEKLGGSGIDRFFYPLLVIHNENGKITQQGLSGILKTDKVTTVRVIDYLSDKGLVKRQVNKEDRREHLLLLTPKGGKIIPALHKAYSEIEKQALAGLSKKQMEDFHISLNLVQENLSKLPSRKINIKFNSTNKLTK
jgi:DNA-binding MarR family transcriptional regulator